MDASKRIAINITHNFNEREYSRKNLEKYFVFVNTIEYLIFQENICGIGDASLDSILDSIIKCSRGRVKNKEWIRRWITELKYMGLIQCVEGKEIRIKLTEPGKRSYREQLFQSIYANLLNAKDSRRLSIIAILIAVADVVLSLFH